MRFWGYLESGFKVFGVFGVRVQGFGNIWAQGSRFLGYLGIGFKVFGLFGIRVRGFCAFQG